MFYYCPLGATKNIIISPLEKLVCDWLLVCNQWDVQDGEDIEEEEEEEEERCPKFRYAEKEKKKEFLSYCIVYSYRLSFSAHCLIFNLTSLSFLTLTQGRPKVVNWKLSST
jgi:hypothetical protein